MTEVMHNRRIEGAVGDYAPPQDVKPLVQAVDLWTEFGEGESRFAVHQDLNFDVYPGEILTLVGGSGTGKTVLLRQILGLLSPSRGTVTVSGRPSREVISGELAASQVGMLF